MSNNREVGKQRVAHDTVGGQAIVIFDEPATLSALDDREIAKSRAIAATSVFRARLGERTLTFEATPEGFRDRQTGSRWDFFGAAVSGPLARRRLTPVPHVDAFWFACAAFNPSTTPWTEPWPPIGTPRSAVTSVSATATWTSPIPSPPARPRSSSVCPMGALGIAPMLGQPVQVRSRCHHCGTPFEFSAAPPGPGPDAEGVMLWLGKRGNERCKVADSL